MPMVFAYFGPETILPATSSIAAVVGFLLLGGKQACRFALGGVRRLVRPLAVRRPRKAISRFQPARRDVEEGRRAATPRGNS
jgi:hypothetical protein